MRSLTQIMILTSLLLSAAIFGFFYAWVCSTMWGLDATKPEIAIQAMQAMNASVRNATFAPAFFGTPFVAMFTAWLLWRVKNRKAAALFALSGLVYFCFGLVLTMLVNVPMNQALALIDLEANMVEAPQIWAAYSPKWQFWNQTRTLASGVAFLLAGMGALQVSYYPRAT